MYEKREFKIDEKIKPLVDALNSIDYIKTFSSCQGHFDFDDERKDNANIMFSVKNEDKQKMEGLTKIILNETCADWPEALVEIYNRYYCIPAKEGMHESWILKITPNKSSCMHASQKRLYTDNEIQKIIKIIEDYSREYKNQPT